MESACNSAKKKILKCSNSDFKTHFYIEPGHTSFELLVQVWWNETAWVLNKCNVEIHLLWPKKTYLKSVTMVFTNLKSIGTWFGLSNEILYVIIAQSSTKQTKVKFEVRKICLPGPNQPLFLLSVQVAAPWGMIVYSISFESPD